MTQATRDLDHARSDVARGFQEWASFSAQQAAEKAAKSVLQRLGAEAWGHSVADLLSELGRSCAVSEGLLDVARELDKAYIPARYPNAHPSGSPGALYTKTEAERMVKHAEQIVAFCQSLLATL